jgi:NADPH2:quinone reductase
MLFSTMIARSSMRRVATNAATKRSMSDLPPTMRAAVVRATGDAHALKYEADYPTPQLEPNKVIVKNEYAGVNFIDTYHRSGLYARDLPFVGGQEGGGTVAAVSDEAAAQGIKVGDRVAYSILQTYCEYSSVPAAKLVPVPDSVGLDVATSCVVQGLTAHYLTSSAHAGLIQPGEWCLIHGVAGGTCQWAAQMAKQRGFKVIGTCPKGKEDIAAKLGCDELIVLDEVPGTSYEDYESVDIVKRVMEVTDGVGCKSIIDGIGKSTMDISLGSLAQRGIFISFGNASGAVPAFPVLKLIGKSAYMTRPKLLDYIRTREELIERADEIFGWLQDGKLSVAVDTTFPLEQAAEGHMYLEAGKSKGKVLYKI